MAKYKSPILGIDRIKEKLKKLTGADGGFTREEAAEIGKRCVDEMKDMISKGLSPVRGGGFQVRFPRYKDPKKYPGSRKAKTPVNLYLTGKFLADLNFKVVKRAKGGYAPEIGYSDPKQQAKERGHREGANSQPERPTIPIFANGEAFARRIEDIYLQVVFRSIKDKLS